MRAVAVRTRVSGATVLLIAGAACAQTFPADDSWLPATIAAGQVRDSNTDVLSSGGRNIVGADPVNQPSVLLHGDGAYLYLRLRVQDEPTSNSTTWACEIDLDGDATYEYYVGDFNAASSSVAIQTWFNGNRTSGSAAEATTFIVAHNASLFRSTKAATTAPTTNWWVSWAIPFSDFSAIGFPLTATTTWRALCGTTSDGKTHLTTGTSADIAGDGTFSDPVICQESGCLDFASDVVFADDFESVPAP